MRENHDENMCTSSRSLNEEISTLTSLSSDNLLCVSPLPTLPFDLVKEILCRLPVKLLCQLRCICKSWNSLISDSKFAKKHLSMSTTRRLHFLNYSPPLRKYIMTSCPLNDIFTSCVMSTNITQLEYPLNNRDEDYSLDLIVGSCNGIICLARDSLVLLWNPSIRKVWHISSPDIWLWI
jgi:hypothetical protein